MHKLAMAITLVLVTSLPTLAALPPQYQRQAELNAVIEVATEVLGINRLIDTVEAKETDVYSVRSGACLLTVHIVDKPNEASTGMAGPRQFTAEAGDLTC